MRARTFPVVLAWLAAACSNATAGQPCNTTADCVDEAVCIATSTLGRNLCMTPCEAGRRLCADGTVCLETSAGPRVCYLGGRTSIGDPCSDDEQCEAGTVCSVEHGACLQACRVPFSCACRDNERCEGPTELEGVCLEIPDASPIDGGLDAGCGTP